MSCILKYSLKYGPWTYYSLSHSHVLCFAFFQIHQNLQLHIKVFEYTERKHHKHIFWTINVKLSLNLYMRYIVKFLLQKLYFFRVNSVRHPTYSYDFPFSKNKPFEFFWKFEDYFLAVSEFWILNLFMLFSFLVLVHAYILLYKSVNDYNIISMSYFHPLIYFIDLLFALIDWFLLRLFP